MTNLGSTIMLIPRVENEELWFDFVHKEKFIQTYGPFLTVEEGERFQESFLESIKINFPKSQRMYEA